MSRIIDHSSFGKYAFAYANRRYCIIRTYTPDDLSENTIRVYKTTGAQPKLLIQHTMPKIDRVLLFDNTAWLVGNRDAESKRAITHMQLDKRPVRITPAYILQMDQCVSVDKNIYYTHRDDGNNLYVSSLDSEPIKLDYVYNEQLSYELLVLRTAGGIRFILRMLNDDLIIFDETGKQIGVQNISGYTCKVVGDDNIAVRVHNQMRFYAYRENRFVHVGDQTLCDETDQRAFAVHFEGDIMTIIAYGPGAIIVRDRLVRSN